MYCFQEALGLDNTGLYCLFLPKSKTLREKIRETFDHIGAHTRGGCGIAAPPLVFCNAISNAADEQQAALMLLCRFVNHCNLLIFRCVRIALMT